MENPNDTDLKDDKLSSCCQAPYRVIREDLFDMHITVAVCSVCNQNCSLVEPPKQETLEIDVNETIKLKDVPM